MSDEIKEFEYSLLKGLLSNGEYFNKAFKALEPSYFSDIGTKKTFELIKEYFKQYHAAPKIIEVANQVKDVPNAEVRKQIAETLQKVNHAEVSENLQFMLDETLKYIKNTLYYKALEIGAEGLQKHDENLQLKAQQILDVRAKVSFDESIGIQFDDIQEMIKYFSERNYGLKTSLKSLNKRLGSGFLPGTLNVICAAQGVGKSLLMCHLASDFLKAGKNILMVSLEMADKEMLKRIYANVLDIDINSFSDLSKTEGEIKSLERPALNKETILNQYQKYKMSGTCGRFFVKDYPAGQFSSLGLQDLIQKFQIEKNIKFDVVFVDYLGIMKSDVIAPSAGLYSYLKSIGEELRAVAKICNVPVISASQLNRGAVNKTENVDNSMLSDSLGTAMTSDLILLILQSEQMKEQSEVVCKITKNRYTGMTDTFMMNVDYPKMKFIDMINPGDNSTQTKEIVDFINSHDKVNDDFGIITPAKQKNAEEFAKTEETRISKEHSAALKENKPISPIIDDSEAIFKELGL